MIPVRGKRNQARNNKKTSLFCVDKGDFKRMTRPARDSKRAGSVSWRERGVGKYVHGRCFGRYDLPMKSTRPVKGKCAIVVRLSIKCVTGDVQR